MSIKRVFARQIYDCRGCPTVEVDLLTEVGLIRAAVPSTDGGINKNEAFELRDQNNTHFRGRSVLEAIHHINLTIGPQLVKENLDVLQQADIDEFLIRLDGTKNKSQYGVNSILGISMAVAKAGAIKRRIPLYRHIADLSGTKEVILPVPLFNVINGGKRSANQLPQEEIMMMPTDASSVVEAMEMGREVYHILKQDLESVYGLDSIAVWDDGAFVSKALETNKEALTFVTAAIEKAGYTNRIEIAMDMTAGEYYKHGKYDVNFKNPKSDETNWLTPDQLKDSYLDLMRNFPIVSIQDPFSSEDIDFWTNITKTEPIQIVAGQLTLSNLNLVAAAIHQRACNCILLTLNQIGTVTEAIKIHLLAKRNGLGTMVSHTQGETEDTFISDFATGISCGQIKAGSLCRSERLAKYNQLLRIEEELGYTAKFAGRNFNRPTHRLYFE